MGNQRNAISDDCVIPLSPFVLKYTGARSIHFILKELLDEVYKRQRVHSGMGYMDTMLRNLVRAKLELVLGCSFQHKAGPLKVSPHGRKGEFLIEDVAIHVTYFPSSELMLACKHNVRSRLRPIVLTPHNMVMIADIYAKEIGMERRIDIFGVEQFLAGNIFVLGKFTSEGRKATAVELITRYNAIVDELETDPSLKIEISG